MTASLCRALGAVLLVAFWSAQPAAASSGTPRVFAASPAPRQRLLRVGARIERRVFGRAREELRVVRSPQMFSPYRVLAPKELVIEHGQVEKLRLASYRVELEHSDLGLVVNFPALRVLAILPRAPEHLASVNQTTVGRLSSFVAFEKQKAPARRLIEESRLLTDDQRGLLIAGLPADAALLWAADQEWEPGGATVRDLYVHGGTRTLQVTQPMQNDAKKPLELPLPGYFGTTVLDFHAALTDSVLDN